MDLSHHKLIEVITDFSNLESIAEQISGDVWFSCLGTTLKTAGTKDKQWKIDYEIPHKFGDIAKRNGVANCVLLSAYGADSKSRIFYSRMKGELEDSLRKMNYHQYIIFKPGMLLRKDTDRPSEKMIGKLLKFINGLGLLKKYKPLSTTLLAEKMAKAPKQFAAGEHTISLEKIFDF